MNLSKDNPIANIFAGVDGSGKTTLYYDKLERKKHFGYRINIDEIVSSFGDWREEKDQFRAGKIACLMLEKCIKKQISFNQEVKNIYKDDFIELRGKGYKIHLYYVGVDSVEIAKQRVAMRVAKGGHDIAHSVIEKRYIQSFYNLNEVIDLCDEIYLYDNSVSLRYVGRIRKNQFESKNIIETMPKWIQRIEC
ncbi:ATPase [Helicobacter sp. 13S00477-4]|uniref:ATPase n=1 Tax=Helicobacter sp. 13S00477-4 TaxID=1905759 RepID=UPI000BA5C51D|nr:ATPase [Helicobacter sp. 13S00477-4]PAF52130.1 hypothetical protein BKH44_03850 [Helicobacter sp. 13S00477-4]